MFSGKGQQEIAVRAIENGANYYLRKEGNTKLLFAELLHHIQQSVSCWRAKKALHEREEALREE